MLHIGIHHYSVEGAVLCYHEIMLEAQRRLGDHQHPVVTMTGLAMAPTIPEWDRKDYSALRARSFEVVERLARTGADFFLCPDNTSHIAMEYEGPNFASQGCTSPKSLRARPIAGAIARSASSAPIGR